MEDSNKTTKKRLQNARYYEKSKERILQRIKIRKSEISGNQQSVLQQVAFSSNFFASPLSIMPYNPIMSHNITRSDNSNIFSENFEDQRTFKIDSCSPNDCTSLHCAANNIAPSTIKDIA
ncbi:MAG: hypothetical protein ACREBJ_09750, partial [Nitrosotalea sp.]